LDCHQQLTTKHKTTDTRRPLKDLTGSTKDIKIGKPWGFFFKTVQKRRGFNGTGGEKCKQNPAKDSILQRGWIRNGAVSGLGQKKCPGKKVLKWGRLQSAAGQGLTGLLGGTPMERKRRFGEKSKHSRGGVEKKKKCCVPTGQKTKRVPCHSEKKWPRRKCRKGWNAKH